MWRRVRECTWGGRALTKCGAECRTRSEVAGLSPDPNLLRSLRQEVGGMWVAPLLGGAVLAVQAQAGLLMPWGRGWEQRSTCISDRFEPLTRGSHPTFLWFFPFKRQHQAWQGRSTCVSDVFKPRTRRLNFFPLVFPFGGRDQGWEERSTSIGDRFEPQTSSLMFPFSVFPPFSGLARLTGEVNVH